MARGRKPSFDYARVDHKIRQMYDDGMGLGNIAKALGLSYKQTVKRRCQAMGIEIRGISEGMFLFHARKHNKSFTRGRFKAKAHKTRRVQRAVTRSHDFKLLTLKKRRTTARHKNTQKKRFPIISPS